MWAPPPVGPPPPVAPPWAPSMTSTTFGLPDGRQFSTGVTVQQGMIQNPLAVWIYGFPPSTLTSAMKRYLLEFCTSVGFPHKFTMSPRQGLFGHRCQVLFSDEEEARSFIQTVANGNPAYRGPEVASSGNEWCLRARHDYTPAGRDRGAALHELYKVTAPYIASAVSAGRVVRLGTRKAQGQLFCIETVGGEMQRHEKVSILFDIGPNEISQQSVLEASVDSAALQQLGMPVEVAEQGLATAAASLDSVRARRSRGQPFR